MPPPPALRLNPKGSQGDTSPLPAPDGAPRNPPTPRNPRSLCRSQFRSLCVRSIVLPPPPRTRENASSPAHLDCDTSARPASVKPTPSSTAQSILRKSGRAFSPTLRRAPPAPDSRILRAFLADVQDNGRTKELFRWNLIHGRLARREMNRRVQMRAVMLQHPKAPREVPVLLHRGVYLRLKPLLIPRP